MSRAADIAYEAIRQRLENKFYMPGNRLSESEISEICGVSRTPVREALRRLAIEYCVRIEPNRGAIAIDWSQEDIMDMFEMRSMMEGLAARKAAERRSEEQLHKLNIIIDKIDTAIRSNTPELRAEFLALNRQFHDLVFEASGSRRLTDIIARFVEKAVIARTAAKYSPKDIERSNQNHKDLVAAIEARNGLLAESIMRVHILAASERHRDGYTNGVNNC